LFCSTIDWVFFLLLDIGNSVIDSIPVGVRVIDGMFQATAVRAAGFAIVSLSALAPAVKYVAQLVITP
jgi:Trk-type K+ transport system membrane component